MKNKKRISSYLISLLILSALIIWISSCNRTETKDIPESEHIEFPQDLSLEKDSVLRSSYLDSINLDSLIPQLESIRIDTNEVLNENPFNGVEIALGKETFYLSDDVIVNSEEYNSILLFKAQYLAWSSFLDSQSIGGHDYNREAMLVTDSYLKEKILNGEHIPVDLFDFNLNLWKDIDTLYYTIVDSNLSKSELDLLEESLNKAFISWEDHSRIVFKKAMIKDRGDLNFEIHFIKSRRFLQPSCTSQKGVFASSEIGPGKGGVRKVIVFWPFFEERAFSRPGILRHEIGHLLGFRHTCLFENIYPSSLNCEIVADYMFHGKRLVYDTSSVMKSLAEACHFNDYELRISDGDKIIIKSFYGKN